MSCLAMEEGACFDEWDKIQQIFLLYNNTEMG